MFKVVKLSLFICHKAVWKASPKVFTPAKIKLRQHRSSKEQERESNVGISDGGIVRGGKDQIVRARKGQKEKNVAGRASKFSPAMHDDWTSFNRIGVSRVPHESDEGQGVKRHPVIGPCGEVILIHSSFRCSG